MEENKKLTHNLILKRRKELSITGVVDVDSFDEETVIAYTDIGELTVKGENLHISKINLDTGDLFLDGTVSLLSYSDASCSKKQSLFSKIFK